MAVIVNGAGLHSDLVMAVKGHSASVGLIDSGAEPSQRIVLLFCESVSFAILAP